MVQYDEQCNLKIKHLIFNLLFERADVQYGSLKLPQKEQLWAYIMIHKWEEEGVLWMG